LFEFYIILPNLSKEIQKVKIEIRIMILKGKKVLLVGLGILGGGVATANFLLKQGARLIITDLRLKKELAISLRKIKNLSKTKLVLGKHEPRDFKEANIIVFNPGVPLDSPWLKVAKKYKKVIENDLTLFLKYQHQINKDFRYLAVTGTRGKTTTATWLAKFIPNSVLGGNIPEKGLLSLVQKKGNFVLELSSFQLEFMNNKVLSPHVAIITNLYNDHLNRYKKFQKYLETKALIFKYQTAKDFLVLNKDNKYTKQLLTLKPKAQIYYISQKPLKQNENGLFLQGKEIIFQKNSQKEHIAFILKNLAIHERANLLAAMLGAHLFGVDWKAIVSKISALPEIPFRQELIFQRKGVKIINDSAATSPDATIAAINRFKGKNIILITGGTDKQLEFKDLARQIKKYIKKSNLFLLEGSATEKLIAVLNKIGYYKKEESPNLYETLSSILKNLPISKRKKQVIVFSPGSASFEKFKNEFDRGRQFNNLIKKFIKIWKI